MIIGKDDRTGIATQSCFHNFSRENTGTIYRASKHFVIFSQPVAIVEGDIKDTHKFN